MASVTFKSGGSKQMKVQFDLPKATPLFIGLDLPQRVYVDSHITAIVTALAD